MFPNTITAVISQSRHPHLLSHQAIPLISPTKAGPNSLIRGAIRPPFQPIAQATNTVATEIPHSMQELPNRELESQYFIATDAREVGGWHEGGRGTTPAITHKGLSHRLPYRHTLSI